MTQGKHNSHARASKQHRWNPGGSVASNGYVKLRLGRLHPLSDPNGYAYEHLVVWISAGNNRPKKTEVIHHKNGDKTDNRIENLELITRAENMRRNTIHRYPPALKETIRLAGKLRREINEEQDRRS